jgi:hypothetical protein
MPAATETLRTPALLAGAAFALASAFCAPGAWAAKAAPAASATHAAKPKPAGAAGKAKKSAKKAGGKASAKKDADAGKPGPLADFHGASAPDDVTEVANWVSYTRNNQKRAFVVIDKKNAEVYVFDPSGKLKDHAPVLLGKAVGDDSAPGVGNKPLSQISDEDKTTPAGRFRATQGRNNHGDNVIWIDYNAAVSMHRVRRVPGEERPERLASPEKTDNRISNGCVNVPPQFFDKVLRPTVLKYGAFIYVLPETRTVQQQFGAYDVAKRPQVAQAAEAASRS